MWTRNIVHIVVVGTESRVAQSRMPKSGHNEHGGMRLLGVGINLGSDAKRA